MPQNTRQDDDKVEELEPEEQAVSANGEGEEGLVSAVSIRSSWDRRKYASEVQELHRADIEHLLKSTSLRCQPYAHVSGLPLVSVVGFIFTFLHRRPGWDVAACLCLSILLSTGAVVLACLRKLSRVMHVPVFCAVVWSTCLAISLSQECEQRLQAAFSIGLVLVPAAMGSPIPAWFFLLLGQVMATQNTVLDLVRLEGCSGEYETYRDARLPTRMDAALRLHVMAALLAALLLQCRVDGCVSEAALTFAQSHLARLSLHEDPDDDDETNFLQHWLERFLKELDTEEQECRVLIDEVARLASCGSTPPLILVLTPLANLLQRCCEGLRTQHGSSIELQKKQLGKHISNLKCSRAISGYLEGSWTPAETSLARKAARLSHSDPGPRAENAASAIAATAVEQYKEKQRRNSKCHEQALAEFSQPMLPLSTGPDDDLRSMVSSIVSSDYVDFGGGDWDFDAFKAGHEHPRLLKDMGMHLLKFCRFLSHKHLASFLEELQDAYVKTNSYHSHLHAVDMCNSFFFLLTMSGLLPVANIPDTTFAAMIIAALGHDVGHFERSNQFLVACNHELAIVYNENSVLENFHASTLRKLLDRHRKIFGDLQHAQAMEGRKLMIKLILGTDTQKHLEALAQFKIRIHHSEFDPVENNNEQEQSIGVLFRAADIGHSAKVWHIHEKWSGRVTQEFFAQGDDERQRGLPVSPLCDRNNFNMAESQIGFIKFVCLPTWQLLSKFEVVLRMRCDRNRASYVQTAMGINDVAGLRRGSASWKRQISSRVLPAPSRRMRATATAASVLHRGTAARRSRVALTLHTQRPTWACSPNISKVGPKHRPDTSIVPSGPPREESPIKTLRRPGTIHVSEAPPLIDSPIVSPKASPENSPIASRAPSPQASPVASRCETPNDVTFTKRAIAEGPLRNCEQNLKTWLSMA